MMAHVNFDHGFVMILMGRKMHLRHELVANLLEILCFYIWKPIDARPPCAHLHSELYFGQ